MAIMTESSMKDYYRNQRTGALNTYDTLFGTVNMQEKAALGSLKYDYGKALNEAYIASQNQANAIMASNLGTGYKERELDKLEPTLQQAYEKYAQSYQQGIYDVEQNANTARTQISEQLSNQAAMATNLTNSTADYLRYLWESTKDNPNSVFYTDPKFQRYTKLNAEEQAKYDAFARDNVLGSKVAKEIGSQYNADVRELMADEDLMNLLYDENGLMTIAGTEFYDILLNADKSLFGDDVLSYNTWLYNQQQAADEKSNYYGLYDWYNAYNPYASNLDEYGLPTNKAYLRTAFGLASSDNAYRFAERWGGFTEEELDSYYDKIRKRYDNISKISDYDYKEHPEKVYDELEGVLKDLRQLAYDFGIEDEVESTFAGYEDILKAARNGIKTQGDFAAAWFGPYLSIAAAGAAAGTVGGPVGMAVGAVLGAAMGTFAGFDARTQMAEENKETAISTKELFNNVLAEMYNLSMSERKKAEDAYYGRVYTPWEPKKKEVQEEKQETQEEAKAKNIEETKAKKQEYDDRTNRLKKPTETAEEWYKRTHKI